MCTVVLPSEPGVLSAQGEENILLPVPSVFSSDHQEFSNFMADFATH
jgi:hypothetical protein